MRLSLRDEELFVAGAVVVAEEWIGHSRRGRELALLMPAFTTHLYRYGAANR